VVEPNLRAAAPLASVLRYEISVVPKLSIPSTIVAYVVRAGLPANIAAIAAQAEEVGPKDRSASSSVRLCPLPPDAVACALLGVRARGWAPSAPMSMHQNTQGFAATA
jgi:hypothetical protein